MNALLLDHTHPLLEQGLEQGGIGLWREYELAPKDFPSDYFTAEVVVQESKVYFVQGFIGSDPAGRPTTLGREGSDYTGAVFAYCLDANGLTIWKDVPGMLNGDPKTFQNTSLIEELPLGEAIELAFYGASIIHPKTIQPLQEKGIPLHIKSFVNPVATGTVINSADKATPQVPNFILKKNQALLSISTMDLAFIAEHHLSAVYQLFAEKGVVVNMMRNTATKAVFCLNNDAIIVPKVIAALQSDFNLTFTSDVELLTIRHYNESDVVRETEGLTILQEQRTLIRCNSPFKEIKAHLEFSRLGQHPSSRNSLFSIQ